MTIAYALAALLLTPAPPPPSYETAREPIQVLLGKLQELEQEGPVELVYMPSVHIKPLIDELGKLPGCEHWHSIVLGQYLENGDEFFELPVYVECLKAMYATVEKRRSMP